MEHLSKISEVEPDPTQHLVPLTRVVWGRGDVGADRVPRRSREEWTAPRSDTLRRRPSCVRRVQSHPSPVTDFYLRCTVVRPPTQTENLHDTNWVCYKVVKDLIDDRNFSDFYSVFLGLNTGESFLPC